MDLMEIYCYALCIVGWALVIGTVLAVCLVGICEMMG
jgi:hypothetical protein